MSSTDEERRPLVFRVNPNPNWTTRRYNTNNAISPQTSDTNASDSSSNEMRSSLVIRSTSNSSFNRGVDQPISAQHRGACFCVLLCLGFERIAYYGLVGNLILFLNKAPFVWVSYHAESAFMLFICLAFFFSLVGGWIADSYLGRFKTILVAFIIYIVGFVLLSFMSESVEDNVSTDPKWKIHVPKSLPRICAASGNLSTVSRDSPFEENCAWLVYVILILVAVAVGSAKSNLGAFGSDQLSGFSSTAHLSFFNWYYWCSNLGAFVGLGAVAYIEQQVGFNYGFIICTASLGCSVLVFVIGRLFYNCRPPDGSILTNVLKIIKEAYKRKRQRRSLQRLTSNPRPEVSSEEVDGTGGHREKISFLDYAKHQHGGVFHNSLVNDVKKLKMVIAVFASLIPYWIVYYQMQTTFFFQGLHMRLTFDEFKTAEYHINNTPGAHHHLVPLANSTRIHKPQIAAAWLTLFDVLFVIILLPLFDRIIYPKMARAGYPFTFAKRVTLGILFSIAAMIVAGVVEMYRLKSFWPYEDRPCVNASIPQYIANTIYEAANMSVFWQIPQYALIGISEVFASVACLQFAVSVAPKSMKAMVTGLFYLFCGLGSLTGTAIPFIFSESKTWLFVKDYGNINCRLNCTDGKDEKPQHVTHSCHLDYYFFLLGGLQIIGLFIFLLVAYTFGLNRDQPLAFIRPPGQHVQNSRSRGLPGTTS